MKIEVSSCDIPFSEDLATFNRDYLKYTKIVAESYQDWDLSENSMVIGTSAWTLAFSTTRLWSGGVSDESFSTMSCRFRSSFTTRKWTGHTPGSSSRTCKKPLTTYAKKRWHFFAESLDESFLLALSSQSVRVIRYSKKIGFCQPLRNCKLAAKMEFFGCFGRSDRRSIIVAIQSDLTEPRSWPQWKCSWNAVFS